MSIDGIKVNKVKKPIYLVPDVFLPIFMSFLREFLTSIKIIIKKITSKITLKTNRNWRLVSFNSIKLLSIKVKNVKKPTVKLIINIKIINIFFW